MLSGGFEVNKTTKKCVPLYNTKTSLVKSLVFAINSENQKHLLIPLALESNIALPSFQVGGNIGEINTKHVEKASQKKTVMNCFCIVT